MRRSLISKSKRATLLYFVNPVVQILVSTVFNLKPDSYTKWWIDKQIG